MWGVVGGGGGRGRVEERGGRGMVRDGEKTRMRRREGVEEGEKNKGRESGCSMRRREEVEGGGGGRRWRQEA